MTTSEELKKIIALGEGPSVEFKAVLPPSRNIAQSIASLANTKGGHIVLGMLVKKTGVEAVGLSEDFHANALVHKALEYLSPQPNVSYSYIGFEGKKLYVILVHKSDAQVLVEGKVYVRDGNQNKLLHPLPVSVQKIASNKRIQTITESLEKLRVDCTQSQVRLIDHYQTILKLLDNLDDTAAPKQEAKVFTRLLFSSTVDNFETYLSELLYEIFLAKPATLKSSTQMVSVEDVLNCVDLQEFVKFLAKNKISRLQKGSVKGFITENKQISELKVIDDKKANDIEKILQIRHLYSHRNGRVDEKFLQYFPGQYDLNTEHKMTINEVCGTLSYLVQIVADLDKAAISKYNLASL